MNDKVKELHDELMSKVSDLRTSEAWLKAMATAAQFHDYSFGNWMLMWAQASARGFQVTRPAGYTTWQKLDRYVKRGEKGLKIFAPMLRKVEIEPGLEDKVLTGFRIVHVFDVSQTDGAPLETEAIVPVLLEGEGFATIRHAAEAMIIDHGFKVGRGKLGGPNGYTAHRRKEVKIEEDIDPVQATKTTIHELAHVLLHENYECRGTIEVEAESIAYVVCAAAGLDTSQYSVNYVAGWGEETEDPAKAMLATAETVVKTSRKILDYIRSYQALAAQDVA